MARETKVGLIAGLAFIICFAVILANRGQKAKLTTHRPYVVDRGVDPTPSLESPRQHPRRRALARQATTGQAARPRQQPAGGVTSPAVVPTSGSQVVFQEPQTAPDLNAGQSANSSRAAEAAQAQPKALADTTGAGPVSADVDTSRVLTSRDDVEERRRLLQQQLDALSAQADPPRSTQPSPRANRPAPLRVDSQSGDRGSVAPAGQRTPTGVDRPLGRHTVAAGDNLSKIAQRYYGTKSKRVVDAIFAANRAAMSSPDMVRVGMEIVLPAIEGADTSARSPAAGNRPSQATRKSVPSQATFDWYQIKKNDRYMDIARRELGDADRWREIFELNKDKFPDPQMIREGVRIKLPATSVANSAGGRR